MGLYDRDYMRRPLAGEPEGGAGRHRLPSRWRLLVGIGLIVLAAAVIMTLL